MDEKLREEIKKYIADNLSIKIDRFDSKYIEITLYLEGEEISATQVEVPYDLVNYRNYQ